MSNINKSDALPALLQDAPFIIHGSADSVDRYVIYFLKDELPSYADCVALTSKCIENRNVCVVDPVLGVVRKTYKGLPDELNNSLLACAPLHKQQHELPIKHSVRRLVMLKVIRAVRSLLTRFSKSGKRSVIKAGLNHICFEEYIYALKQFDFTSEDFKAHLDVECCKSVAFQLAQTIALCKGKELFSKSDISNEYPDLKCFMQRNWEVGQFCYAVLNKYLHELLEIVKPINSILLSNDCIVWKNSISAQEDKDEEENAHTAKKKKVGYVTAFFLDKKYASSIDKQSPYWNLYQQLNGIVFEMWPGTERCLSYGLDLSEDSGGR